MDLDFVRRVFDREVRRIWGDWVADGVRFNFFVKHQKPRMSIGGFKFRPRAFGNRMVRCNREHNVYVSRDFLSSASEDVLVRVVRHEVLHIGHQLHNEEFFRLCQEFGASLTGESDRAEDLLPFQCQVKEGSRFKTIKRFGSEVEAFEWLKKYCFDNKVRGRIKV